MKKSSEFNCFIMEAREAKRPLGRPRRRLQDNIKMDQEMG